MPLCTALFSTRTSTNALTRPRSEVGGHARLVVGRAPGVEASVPLDRLERVAGPERGVAGRLHVVVRVEQHGRRAGRGRLTADHRGPAALPDDLRVEAAAAQQL